MATLERFKSFNEEGMHVEELVELSAFGKSFKAELEALNLDVPDFVDGNLKTLRRAIRAKTADKLEAEKKRLQMQLDNLKTTAERRAETKKALERLEEQLVDI